MTPPLPPLALIVAVARDGIIGRDGGLPWHLPEDLRHFKRLTRGHAIVMGRRTFESIGRPLPERRNLVVSRTLTAPPPGVELFASLDAALAAARTTDPEPFVIGGAALYAEALPRATTLHLTEIDRDVSGDVRFPLFDRAAFRVADRRPAESAADVFFATLVRVGV
jgi:dihydrofolate reductase